MAEAHEYLSIAGESSAMFKDRGSKFYSFAYPVHDEAEIKEKLHALREKYPDATHHCYAWVLGADRSRYRANDDGEPNHSAGTPILRQIHSFELSQILVVVVRYYGGVNLGVPGLIHAYGNATRMALETSILQKKKLKDKVYLKFPFGEEGHAYRLAHKVEANILSFNHDPNPVLYLEIDKDKRMELDKLVTDYPNIEMICE